MKKIDDVIKATEVCLSGGLPQRCVECPYHKEECSRGRMEDSLQMLKDYKKLLNELIKVGVPHNFQREQPWLVKYMYDITKIVKKAYEVVENDET